MKRSTDRILTTHVGSLIRPDALIEFMHAKEAGKPFDQAAYEECLTDSVATVVKQQADIGVDVISDGEFGKTISWAQYALERLGGFERRVFNRAAGNPWTRGADRTRFAEFYAELDGRDPIETTKDSVIVSPVSYTGQAILQRDIDNFNAGLKNAKVDEAFLPVAAPASAIPDRKNEYYQTDEESIRAVGKAMAVEYRAIVDAGFIVQLDDARAAVTYDRMVPPKTLADFRDWLELHTEVLNDAITGIPPEKIRCHVCWGSWPGPHVSDVPVRDIIDIILKVKAGAYSLEMANPRHEHEWQVWKDVKLPDGKILIPGVISHSTNVVEHPELVAERIGRLAKLVGRENVIAGTDCGFAQATFLRRVHPSIQWAKLEALVEGGRIATKQLWG
ncbi:MAG: hypothetical protein GEU91_02540 [Rhizobiales bacterium]|nr:hypothetical protein [Hyphomicrobiales bacterium]